EPLRVWECHSGLRTKNLLLIRLYTSSSTRGCLNAQLDVGSRVHRRGELLQLGDVALQRGAVQRNVRGPGQDLKTGAQPAFRLLPVGRLNAGELAVCPGGFNHTLKRSLELRMI